jgi:acyl dehydratase
MAFRYVCLRQLKVTESPVKLSTDFAGSKLREYRTEVTWRRTMNYAAAVGDNNPVYFNDERAGGVIAPPMFAVALTWPICEKIWEFIQVDDFPKELLVTLVHYTEHLTFHRTVRPGDRLTIQGRIAAILPHKAGALMVLRLAAVDEKGAPVFTEHIGGLLRGVQCLGEAKISEALPEAPAAREGGTPLWESAVFVDPLAPFVYDGCTDIVFPIHTSAAFAHNVGLPNIILQGTATLAFAARELLNREADADPSLLGSIACRFVGMVLPGTRMRIVLLERRADPTGTDLFFTVRNSKGDDVIAGGYARLHPKGGADLAT